MPDMTTDTTLSGVLPDFLGMGDFVYRNGPPVVISSAHGCILSDRDGATYFDAEASNGTAAFGYDPELVLHAAQAAGRLPGCPSFLESDLRLRTSRKVRDFIERSTGKRGRVAFDLGGAQGIELAIKVACRNRPGRRIIVVLEGAYHGRSIFTSHLSASVRYRDGFPGTDFEIVRLPVPSRLRDADGAAISDGDISQLVSESIRIFEDERGGHASEKNPPDIAAFLFESLQNVSGMLLLDRRFVRGLVEYFRQHGALIVADEVFTGFYRTGHRFGIDRLDVSPDMLVASKALTNGCAPLSCVWAQGDLLAPSNFPPGTHSITFAGNPFGLALADSVIDRFEAWTTVEQDIQKMEASLDQMAMALRAKYPQIRSHRAVGATLSLRFVDQVATAFRHACSTAFRDRPVRGMSGVFVASTGLSSDSVAVHPPLIASDNDIDLLSDLLDAALSAFLSDRLSSR